MVSAKDSLMTAIDQLSDEELLEVLEFVKRIQTNKQIRKTNDDFINLSDHPGFVLPSHGSGNFQSVEPIKGAGMPASKLLIDDRR